MKAFPVMATFRPLLNHNPLTIENIPGPHCAKVTGIFDTYQTQFPSHATQRRKP